MTKMTAGHLFHAQLQAQDSRAAAMKSRGDTRVRHEERAEAMDEIAAHIAAQIEGAADAG